MRQVFPLQISSCSFVTNTHLVASLILCLISLVLLITSISLWIGLKKRRESKHAPTSYTESFELTNKPPVDTKGPILPPTVDYTIPDFLTATSAKNGGAKKMVSLENGSSVNGRSDGHA